MAGLTLYSPLDTLKQLQNLRTRGTQVDALMQELGKVPRCSGVGKTFSPTPLSIRSVLRYEKLQPHLAILRICLYAALFHVRSS
jgi:hypothetical protein